MDQYSMVALGIMSGTSLDGLDLALCRFDVLNGRWSYEILKAETIPYPEEWQIILKELHIADALTISLTHTRYGRWIGQACNQFLTTVPVIPQIIASHGHTIFHRPGEGMTLQIGSGAAIAAETGITTVCDFRSLDVALGGQGAPLVPIGDKLLFGDFAACVNIGGFANLSFQQEGRRVAWDICPANFILNREAGRLGLKMDESGNLARKGTISDVLLDKLNNLDYYSQPGPKSLGREWVEARVLPLLTDTSWSPETILRTFTEHIAIQTGHALRETEGGTVLFTGGGVHNTFLMERISRHTSLDVKIPSNETVDFKEALIFALLGVLRINNQNNCLAEVTGALRDNCGGSVFQP
ncbi:MAG: anhydro-N-acetylmuramic acid kinase [Bacteroidales bacterium]|nr:anhydro-N-acetylmuramic acid kinase [Bacteroidales bacterium]